MKYCSKADLLEFESQISSYWEEGSLPFLIHLSGGNEDFLIDYFDQQVKEGDWILSSHRNHYHALLSGIPKKRLESLILQGDSMFVFDRARNFLTSSVLAGLTCVAAGISWSLKNSGSKNRVHCFVGDGAEDEGHLYEAVLMTMGHNLPCKFIIEDNNRSVDSSLEERLPAKFRIQWPNCVVRNTYTPIYPHAGNGTSKKIVFQNIKPREH